MKTYLDYVKKEEIEEKYRNYNVYYDRMIKSEILLNTKLLFSGINTYEEIEAQIGTAKLSELIKESLRYPIPAENAYSKNCAEEFYD